MNHSVDIRRLSERIVALHEAGARYDEILSMLVQAGMGENQAAILIGSVLDLYDEAGRLYTPKTWLQRHTRIRAILLALAAFALMLGGSLVLYGIGFGLRNLFEAAGQFTLAKLLGGVLQYPAGAVLGFLSLGAVGDYRSAGLFLGLWLGVVCYYLWLFGFLDWLWALT
ncbi:hypothetical protein [Coralliovum pocilloporae]|uniref:hypothetical protein n=1 Tax=Coralliovum pocilloporae TaxID=3066369 RepID=UPI0033070E1E